MKYIARFLALLMGVQWKVMQNGFHSIGIGIGALISSFGFSDQVVNAAQSHIIGWGGVIIMILQFIASLKNVRDAIYQTPPGTTNAANAQNPPATM